MDNVQELATAVWHGINVIALVLNDHASGVALAGALRDDAPTLLEVPVGEMPDPWPVISPGYRA